MDLYQPGDEVYLIHSRQYGWIVERWDEDSWIVDLDGDHIPVHEEDMKPADEADQAEVADDVPPISADFKIAMESPAAMMTYERTTDQAIPGVPATKPQSGFYQLFVPSPYQRYERWIVNATRLGYQAQIPEWPEFAGRQDLPAGARLPLGHFVMDALHEQEALTLKLFWKEKDAFGRILERSFQKDLRIRTKAFVKQVAAFQESQQNGRQQGQQQGRQQAQQEGIVFMIFAEKPPEGPNFPHFPNLVSNYLREPDPSFQVKSKLPFSNRKPASKREPFSTEIDLHADKLIDHPEKLHPAEILAIQLSRATHYLDQAVVQKARVVYLIHGLGSGRLRQELHEMLRANSHVKHFCNEYFPQYGFGATEVQLHT